ATCLQPKALLSINGSLFGLADDLRQWLAAELVRLQAQARDQRAPTPARLPAAMRIFTVPKGLIRILDRDLEMAGIAKTDERGRTLDVHALRTTFCTLLSVGGVAPRTAQSAMRHSDIRLTMQTYTDPKLLDVRGALDSLPALPLGAGSKPSEAILTGTDASPLAPRLAPNWCKRTTPQSKPDRMTSAERVDKGGRSVAASA